MSGMIYNLYSKIKIVIDNHIFKATGEGRGSEGPK